MSYHETYQSGKSWNNNKSQSLIDLLLTCRPELFKRSGNYYSALSDHALISCIVPDNVKLSKPKVISF